MGMKSRQIELVRFHPTAKAVSFPAHSRKNILRIGMDSLRNVKVPIEAPTPLG